MIEQPVRDMAFTWNRLGFALLFLIFLFCVLLPLLCKRLKYSIYYGVMWSRNVTAETNELRQFNDERLLLAREDFGSILNDYSKGSRIAEPMKNSSDIVVCLITVSRRTDDYNPSYLTQTVSKLLRYLGKSSSDLSFRYGLMVCNVDLNPNEYTEAFEMAQFVHTIVKYKKKLVSDLNKFEKEKQDYLYCLSKALEYSPKYVLLMEDDAYPRDQMFPVLEYGIKNIFEGKICDFCNRQETVAYLKLYHPERLLGFISTEFYRLVELGAAISILLTLLSICNRSRTCCYMLSWKGFLVIAVYIVLLSLAIGRQNLIFIRRISKYFYSFVPAPSCCTPANLYSFQGGMAVIKSLSGKTSHAGHAKDALLDEFLDESNYKAIYVEPNIFEHIGQYSSLRKGTVLDPYVV